MSSLLEIVIKAVDNASGTFKQVNEGLGGVKGAANKANDALSGIRGTLSTGLKVAAAGGVGAILGIGVAVAKTGFEFDSFKQQSMIAFEQMLGSGEKAQSFLNDLQAFAAKTPFEFPGLVDSARQLMAMGFASEDVLPTLTSVGDAVAAMGGGADLVARVTRALGQMKAKGKAAGGEMMQLTEAGIPAWEFLAKKIGVDIPTAMDMVSKGAVKSETVISAVTEGMNKKFGGMMEKQSGSWSGLLSTLQDNFKMFSGTVMQPVFEAATKGMNKLVELTSKPEVTQWAETLGKKVAGMVESFMPWVEKQLPIFLDMLPGIIDQTVQFARAVGDITTQVIKVVVPVAEFITNLIGLKGVAIAVLGILAGPMIASIIGLIVPIASAVAAIAGFIIALNPVTVIVGAIVIAIVALYKAWSSNFLGIQDITKAVIGKITDWFIEIPKVLVSVGQAIFKGASNAFEKFSAGFDSVKNNVKAGVNSAIGFVQDAWTTRVAPFATSVYEGAKKIFNNIGSGFVAVRDSNKTILGTAVDAVKTSWETKIAPFATSMLDGGKKILTALGTGFVGAHVAVYNLLASALNSVKQAWIDGLPNFLSRFFEGGKAILNKLGDGFTFIRTAVYNTLATALSVINSAWTNALPNFIGRFFEGGKTILNKMGDGFTFIRTTVYDKLAAALGVVNGAWNNALPNFLGRFFEGGKTILNKMGDGFTFIRTTVYDKLATALGVVNGAWNNALPNFLGRFFEGGKTIFGKLGEGFRNVEENVKSALVTVMNNVKEHGWGFATGSVAQRLYDAAKSAITRFATGFRDGAPGLMNDMSWVVDQIPGVFNGFIDGFKEHVWGKANETVRRIADGFRDFDLGGAIWDVLDRIPQAFNSVMDGFKDHVWNTMRDIGKDVSEGLADGIRDKLRSITDALRYITDYLPQWVKSQLGIGSPSKVFADIAQWIPQGIAKGIMESAQTPVNALSSLMSGMATAASTGTSSVAGAASNTTNNSTINNTRNTTFNVSMPTAASGQPIDQIRQTANTLNLLFT